MASLARYGFDPEPADLLDELNSLIEDQEFAIGPSYLMTSSGQPPGSSTYRSAAFCRCSRSTTSAPNATYAVGFGLTALRDRLAANAEDGDETVDVPENDQSLGDEAVNLPAEVARAVADSGLVRVELEHPPDRWRLAADSRVGIAMGENWEIRVVPRLAIPKLIFLLGYASDPNGWRELTAPMAREEELFRAIASGFATHALRAIESGVLRGYLSTDESAAVIRGRIRIGDQLARRPGLLLPVEIRYDDYTTDIPENRLLAAASTLLLRLARLPELTARS